ncbi:polysaccharide lyase 8 family protein [Actinopolymorpha sp. B17G11]|uniref:polysaccharide lyase 8 family protein n=1 Tax=Actinopolymorpha sp. B17G11 TaxID=3160861 RepID=UPI0032E4F0D7
MSASSHSRSPHSGRAALPGRAALSRRALLLSGAAVTVAGAAASMAARPAPAAAATAAATAGSSTTATATERASAGAVAAAADEFTQMREQWRSLWVAADYDPTDPNIAPVLARIAEEGQTYWSTMDRSAERTYLWEDAQLEVQISFAISVSFYRLRQMALAWATPGTDLTGNADLLADIIAAFDWMVAHYYREDGEIIGNWYEWQISGPQAFNDAVVLTYAELTPEQVAAYTRAVANFTPEPFATAANRALSANVVVGWGALAGNADAVTKGTEGLVPVFEYATSGDGFYRDGSFLQHRTYPYVGAYGASILDALVPLLGTVANTAWQVDAPIVYAWIRDTFDPVIWRGALLDSVSGRTISRYNEHEHYHGHYVLEAAIGLAASAPDDQRDWLRSVLKEWLLSDTFDDPTPQRNIPIVLTAKALIDDDTTKRRGELLLSKVFHHQDRIVHRRPGWLLGIAMNSTRIARFESINSENFKAWMTADGATFLHADDSGRYVDAYWPTIDPYRIPGTTVDVRPRTLGEGRNAVGPNPWAGGAFLDNRFTAGGMHLTAQGGTLTVRKSWMCFDDEVVALGAGITATDGRRAETIVENRRLGDTGDEKVRANGDQIVKSLGDSATVKNARWLHVEDTGGYVFPKPVALQVLREARTGKWSDITHHPVWAKDDPITANYLTALLDHGVDPADDSYAYVLLPTAGAGETARYSERPETAIVANSSAVQAARRLDAGVLCANFWQPGEASLVSTTGGVSVVVEEGDSELALAVADPTHLATTLTLGVAVTATDVVSADDGLTVTSLDPLTVEVDLTGAGGASRTLRVAYAPLTVADVRARLNELRDRGEAEGAYASLEGQLTTIEAAVEDGKPSRELVDAFRRTVAGHRGDGINESATGILDDLAQRLIARLS